MTRSHYMGPGVYGFDTDRPLRRAAQISVHTSPLATLGGKDAGGMNVYVRELSANLGRLGLPIDVFTRRDNPDTPEIQTPFPNVNVIAITAGPPEPLDKNALFEHLPEFAAQMALFSLREGVRYDVVHAHYWLSGWAAHLVKRYWDTPFIQMFHTTAHMKNAVADTIHRETDLRGRTEQRLLALADSIIAANPDERADLVWRMGAANEKVCAIPPGVDLSVFEHRNGAAKRAELGLAPDDDVLLFCGRIDPIKGIETLLETVRLLSTRAKPPVVLFIGGNLDAAGEPSGPLAEVVSQTEALGIRQLFRFLGSRPQDELPDYYCAADIVVVPSRYESFGLVAVEALASGVPVIASRVGGLKYIVEENEAGFLVPMGNPAAFARAIGELFDDPAMRDRFAVHARPSVERFAWPAVARSVLHVYERLSAGQRGNLCHEATIFANPA